MAGIFGPGYSRAAPIQIVDLGGCISGEADLCRCLRTDGLVLPNVLTRVFSPRYDVNLTAAQMHHEIHRHRIPLGLLMLEQGWITPIQLRKAVEAQRAAGVGRLGQWLVEQRATEESMVTRALGLQWSCPVLALQSHSTPELTAVMPRLFVDAFGALPLRLAAGRLLYLGFEEGPDPVLALAVERMLKLRVECGVVQGSHFRSAHKPNAECKVPVVGIGGSCLGGGSGSCTLPVGGEGASGRVQIGQGA